MVLLNDFTREGQLKLTLHILCMKSESALGAKSFSILSRFPILDGVFIIFYNLHFWFFKITQKTEMCWCECSMLKKILNIY